MNEVVEYADHKLKRCYSLGSHLSVPRLDLEAPICQSDMLKHALENRLHKAYYGKVISNLYEKQYQTSRDK